MNINTWKLGLAGLGMVGLCSVALADSAPAPTAVLTALPSTTISGYVDTSAIWNPGTGNTFVAPYSYNGGHDGFNVDEVDVKIQKSPDEGKWAAGYAVELAYGPYAPQGAGTPLRQAYVEMKAPVGNGIDIQMGRFDNLLGFEGNDTYKQPNFTRSYGYSLEPTVEDGVVFGYAINSSVNVQLGVVDTVSTGGLNARNASGAGGTTIESKKGFISLVTLTAPDSMGSFKGSTLSFGLDYGPGPGNTAGTDNPVDRTEAYVGASLNTPVKDLTFGAAWDAVWNYDAFLGGAPQSYAQAIAGYSSYKLTDKMTLNLRGDWAHGNFLTTAMANQGETIVAGTDPFHDVLGITGTLQYDLWANVISRVEVRWDHDLDGAGGFGNPNPITGVASKNNEVTVAANVIYKF